MSIYRKGNATCGIGYIRIGRVPGGAARGYPPMLRAHGRQSMKKSKPTEGKA